MPDGPAGDGPIQWNALEVAIIMNTRGNSEKKQNNRKITW